MKMLPSTRLVLCGVIILGSLLYLALVLRDPTTASALMLGYVGILLTIFVAIQIWKREHDHRKP